jgi:tetratricopeptide (TPR) repeat protein/predicted Ser/Thr protein kinase
VITNEIGPRGTVVARDVMSLVDDDTVLRQSDLEQMRELTLGDATEPEDDRSLLPGDGHGPTRLGHYVLLSKLGQGGMGLVYAAYDERLDRKVALKLLHSAGDPKARKRLLREAQSMARLSHPNVAQVYEIATDGQLTFIVMEFINGQTLRAWLNGKRRSQRSILDVFMAAGRGLAAAHAQGLVHRDFKPDNVMIRDDGRVLVMDFGLAHVETEPGGRVLDVQAHPLAEPSGLTATGVLMGTPAYMAPEQFEGRETDARTDQFSFCVALWEALHGQRPFRGTTLMDLSVAVCSGSLSIPEHSEVPSWLRKQLVRGLEVEPARRWPTIDALLDALRRDPTRRWRALLIGVGVVAASLAVLGAVQLGQARTRAELIDACEQDSQALVFDAQVQARLATAFERTGLGYAPDAWAHTRALLDAYARSWSDARRASCIEVEVEHSRDAREGALIESCLDERRATFEGVIAAWSEVDEHTLARATAAAARLPPVSSCTTELWLTQRMQAPTELLAEVDGLRERIDRVKGLSFAGKYDDAVAQLEPILREAEQLEWLPLIAEARLELGALQYKRGDYEASRVSVELAYREAVATGHDMTALASVALLCVNVGDKLANLERGLFWCELGSSYVARLGLGDSVRAAQVLDNLGSVHTRAGAFADALAAHERARQMTEAALGAEHLHVAVALNNAGGAQWSLGRHDDALASFRAGLRIKQAVLGERHPEVATTLNNIGAVHWSMGDYEQALAAFREGLALREAALGPKHPDVAGSLNNIGAVYASRGESAEALVYFRRSLESQELALGSEHPDVAGALTNIGTILRKQGAYAEALETHRRAVAIWETSLGPEHPSVAMALNNVGVVQWQLREFEQARATHLRALAIREKALGPEHAEIAQSLDNLGDVTYSLGHADEAIALHRRALAMREKVLGPEHPDVGDSLDSLGDVLRQSGQAEQALALHRRALAIYEAEFGPESSNTAFTLLLIGLAQLELAQHDEARAALERALSLREQAGALPADVQEVQVALARVAEQQRAP